MRKGVPHELVDVLPWMRLLLRGKHISVTSSDKSYNKWINRSIPIFP
jgi:hypothetical protein